MIVGLKPYPVMKDSGVPWLGEMPAHWGIERAKWLFRRMDRPARQRPYLTKPSPMGPRPSALHTNGVAGTRAWSRSTPFVGCLF